MSRRRGRSCSARCCATSARPMRRCGSRRPRPGVVTVHADGRDSRLRRSLSRVTTTPSSSSTTSSPAARWDTRCASTERSCGPSRAARTHLRASAPSTATRRLGCSSARAARLVPHDREGHRTNGVDALRTLALALARGEEEWPDLVAFLGDQVYADDTSQAMREFIAARRDIDEPPGEEIRTTRSTPTSTRWRGATRPTGGCCPPCPAA